MSTQVTSSTKTLRSTALLVTLFTAAALSACGGGGSGGGDSSTAAGTVVAPAPAPVSSGGNSSTRQPVTSVPTPTYVAGSFQLDALNHLNTIRSALGLGLFAQSTSLDTAATAHVNYVKINGSANLHTEISGLTGFTGVSSGDRMIAAGYTYTSASEDMGFIGQGAAAVDDMLDSVYHRIPLFSYKFKDIGIGEVQTHVDIDPAFNAYSNTFDMGYIGSGQGAPSTIAVIWPADNSTTTSISMPAESPRPGAPGTSGVFGYPVSISVDEERVIVPTSFTLTDNTGAAVACNQINAATDTNLAATTLSPKAYAAIVPRDSLKPATVYTVQFVGTIDGAAYSKTWSFKTP